MKAQKIVLQYLGRKLIPSGDDQRRGKGQIISVTQSINNWTFLDCRKTSMSQLAKGQRAFHAKPLDEEQNCEEIQNPISTLSI